MGRNGEQEIEKSTIWWGGVVSGGPEARAVEKGVLLRRTRCDGAEQKKRE